MNGCGNLLLATCVLLPVSHPLHRPQTIDQQWMPGHKRRSIRTEPDDNFGDVSGWANLSDRFWCQELCSAFSPRVPHTSDQGRGAAPGRLHVPALVDGPAGRRGSAGFWWATGKDGEQRMGPLSSDFSSSAGTRSIR